jgi:hypothetical protein
MNLLSPVCYRQVCALAAANHPFRLPVFRELQRNPNGFEGLSLVILEPAIRAACPGIAELATEDLRQRGLQGCAEPKPRAKISGIFFLRFSEMGEKTEIVRGVLEYPHTLGRH